ncbi:putative HhH-GPD family protein [Methanoculleus chikugoensis]|uniref:Putative HhH-GPD family protein n=1 Tax=Methanoculleus chikugoensis TaxID=118126 RepID=A0A1M4MP89_9EURY|nr:putative HhH-GPD family protein [Methanoculleus chikugoensis]
MIPYRISEIIGGTEFQKYLSLDLSTTKRIFIQHSLHRMPSQMAYCHFKAVEKIHLDYHDDASLIWKRDDPTSADVIKRFSEFYGVGQKISTMAANILVREFKIDLIDKSAIDISVDVHIERVFKRIGFVPKDATRNDIINLARELYPEYPGIFDSVCWEIGEAWCRPNSPLCENCILKGLCASYQTRSHKKDD